MNCLVAFLSWSSGYECCRKIAYERKFNSKVTRGSTLRLQWMNLLKDELKAISIFALKFSSHSAISN